MYNNTKFIFYNYKVLVAINDGKGHLKVFILLFVEFVVGDFFIFPLLI